MLPEDVAPDPSELPSPRTLRRATVVAIVVAIALYVIAVLPAEHNIDPTGIGRITGLKEIGEIKQEAREGAAAAAAIRAQHAQSGLDSVARADSARATP